MADFTLSPSLLAANFADLKSTLDLLKQENITALHLDVMDGNFVPAISFGVPVIQGIRAATDMFLDAHLMVENPLKQVPQFIKAGVDGITIHIEAGTESEIINCLKLIKQANIKAGLSLKPATPVSELEKYASQTDLVLLMSVEPGAGGQSFIPESLARAKEIKKLLPHTELQIDGGINLGTLAKAQNAGATNFVAGTAILKGNISKNIQDFRDILQQGKC